MRDSDSARLVPADGLLDRDDQLARLDAILDEVIAGAGRVLVIEGPAGIGKSSLLAALGARASAQDSLVLSARGGFLEREFTHGVVRQLYDPFVRSRDRSRVLWGAAEQASAALGLVPSSGLSGPDAMFAANHGLYWLTANLAEEQPVVLLIDDLHWADLATLHFLNYLGSRVDELPVLAAAATRIAEPGSPMELLDSIRGLPTAESMQPPPLGEAAAGVLIERTAGIVPGEELRRACLDATGGNPFLLVQLVMALAADGSPTEVLAERVRRLGPRPVARSVLGRLASLVPDAMALARAVAVLDTDAELRHAAKIASLPVEAGQAAADTLAQAGIFAPERPLRFAHPLIRQAVYEDVPRGRRAHEHARAARVLDADGDDPDRAVVHLLETEPAEDAWTVRKLREGAARALARGAPDTASRLLRRALIEPPEASERARTLLELGRAAVMAGEDDGIDLLSRAVAAGSDLPTRVEASEELASALTWFGDLENGLEVLASAASEVRLADPSLWMRVEAARINATSFTDLALAGLGSRVEDLLPTLDGETPEERILLAAVALQRVICMSGTAAEMISLGERATGHMIRAGEAPPTELFLIGPAFAFVVYDRHDRAGELLAAATSHARRSGSRLALDIAEGINMILSFTRGNLLDVLDMGSAWLARGAFGPVPLYAGAGYQVVCMLAQGRATEADALLRTWGLDDGPPAPISQARWLLVARARVHAALNRRARALRDARAAAALAHPHFGIAQGSRWSPALALYAAGAQEEAIAFAQCEVADAQRVQCSSSEGVAILAHAEVAHPGDTLDLFELALSKLDGSPKRLDLAYALVGLGSALRRTNNRARAREPLEAGMELAYRCTAYALAERAREELVACGARPRRYVRTGAEALSSMERRVARMAAAGMSNTEIAQALFVTRKTIETHLGRVFRKLGIDSRAALADALSS